MADRKVGTISHYYDNIGVAVLEVTDNTVSCGDKIKVTDKDGEEKFSQELASIQMDHENIDEASKGQAVGIKINEAVSEGDLVFKIE